MKKLETMKFSMYLAVFSMFIVIFAYFGMSAFSSRASTNESFSENTSIGGIDVSGKTPGGAQRVLEDKVKNWAATAEISVGYKEAVYQVDTSRFSFLINESISSAADGKRNELLAELDGEAILAVLSIPEAGSVVDQESLESDLLEAAQEFRQTAHFRLTEYLPAEDPEVISRATLKLQAGNEELQDFLSAVPSFEVAGNSSFSLAAAVKEAGLDTLSASASTLLASVIYQAILPTNFTVTERHIGSSIPEIIEPGFEARVDFEKNLDFKFRNPNAFSYTIQFAGTTEELEVSVIGVPMLYEYKVSAGEKQEFKPRTIKQFSPLLSTGQKKVEKEGEAGILVTVTREILGVKGELLETEVVSEDFYPPVHRIEIHPIAPRVQDPASGPLNGAAGTDGAADTVNPLPQDVDSDTGQPPRQDQNNDVTDGDVQQGEDNGSAGSGEYEDDGGLWGKPNEEPK